MMATSYSSYVSLRVMLICVLRAQIKKLKMKINKFYIKNVTF